MLFRSGLHCAPAAGGDIHAFGRDGLPVRRARPHLSDRPAVHGVEGRRCGLRQGGGPSPVAPGVRARAAVTTLARAPAPGDGHQRNSEIITKYGIKEKVEISSNESNSDNVNMEMCVTFTGAKWKNKNYGFFCCDCKFDLDEFTATIDKDYEKYFGEYFKTIHFHKVAEYSLDRKSVV